MGASLSLGHGQGLIRLLQFSGNLASESKQKHQLSWWNELIREYFTPKAIMKFTLWRDNERNEAKPFEIGVPILPRFLLVTTQSGVKSMTLTLDGARERLYAYGHAIVECVAAVWTYRYSNGYTVALRGPLTVHVVVTAVPGTGPGGGAGDGPAAATTNNVLNGSGIGQGPAQAQATQGGGTQAQNQNQNQKFQLKFEDFQFDATFHDKYIALESIMGPRSIESPKGYLPPPPPPSGPTPSAQQTLPSSGTTTTMGGTPTMGGATPGGSNTSTPRMRNAQAQVLIRNGAPVAAVGASTLNSSPGNSTSSPVVNGSGHGGELDEGMGVNVYPGSSYPYPSSSQLSIPYNLNSNGNGSMNSSTSQPPSSYSSYSPSQWDEPRVLISQGFIPGEPVNAFGIPQATMRCLELAESVSQMGDLIVFSKEEGLGPLEALSKMAEKIRESMPNPQPLINGVVGPHHSQSHNPNVHGNPTNSNNHPSPSSATVNSMNSTNIPSHTPMSMSMTTLYSSAPPSVTNPNNYNPPLSSSAAAAAIPSGNTINMNMNMNTGSASSPMLAHGSPRKQQKIIPHQGGSPAGISTVGPGIGTGAVPSSSNTITNPNPNPNPIVSSNPASDPANPTGQPGGGSSTSTPTLTSTSASTSTTTAMNPNNNNNSPNAPNTNTNTNRSNPSSTHTTPAMAPASLKRKQPQVALGESGSGPGPGSGSGGSGSSSNSSSGLALGGLGGGVGTGVGAGTSVGVGQGAGTVVEPPPAKRTTRKRGRTSTAGQG
ncbi:LIM-domain binding protein-domain-containing protein [Lentinula detonsa]|uniref:LIM-domain binding protein-domain-containing protein n=2 Tax=Lentinula detonsa TaxID=2804962 RepID=A0A9W8NYU7_9AGAR|nr:LIM-domain binding protein-domain-containing protein [Lentinula detonsa]